MEKRSETPRSLPSTTSSNCNDHSVPRGYKTQPSQNYPSSLFPSRTASAQGSLCCSQTSLLHSRPTTTKIMPTATTFIPTFCAIILALGGTNGFSIQLMLIGTLATIIHAAWSPPDLTTPYPNFDDYHPTQPPFRDYVLVFGLAGLILVALFSRIRPSVSDFFPLLYLNNSWSFVPAPVLCACHLEENGTSNRRCSWFILPGPGKFSSSYCARGSH